MKSLPCIVAVLRSHSVTRRSFYRCKKTASINRGSLSLSNWTETRLKIGRTPLINKYVLLKTFKAPNGLLCADVPLRNYSLSSQYECTMDQKLSALFGLSGRRSTDPPQRSIENGTNFTVDCTIKLSWYMRFLPRDVTQRIARLWDCMSSVCLSVRPWRLGTVIT